MQIMRHPMRPTPQYAYSERDAAYLESQGWARVETQPAQPERQLVEVANKKRGRPLKKGNNVNHDIR